VKIGLLSDIHENVPYLRVALDRLKALGAERLVVLGDVFEVGERLGEAVGLLEDAGAVGVWGNHDAWFCLGDPRDEVAARYDGRTLRYMATLLPRLELDGCHISHIEPWLDPTLIEDLWWFDSPPDTPDRVAQSFDAVPHRLILVGHVHRWLAAKPGEVLDWRGETPLALDPSARYFVIIHAVADGWAALLDTTANVLTPLRLDGPGSP